MTNEQKNTNFKELLEKRRYNPNNVPKAEEVIFKIANNVIGTASNYVVISGQAKSGKSTFVSAITASAFLPPYMDQFGIKLNLPSGRNKIAYFDTESSLYDFYRQMERIRNFALKSSHPPDLDAFNTREDSPKRIKIMVEEYLKSNPECSILIADGLLDFCLNYNDEVETRQLTNWFKRITKEHNILLIGVLHLGKGGNETLGHLGSNTDRWSQSTLVVTKEKSTNQFVLKPKFLRSSAEFNPIAIQNFDGKWQQVPFIEPEETLNKKVKK